MEPATGASTWALGSQRCTVNIGSLTRKARRTKTVRILKDHISCGGETKTRKVDLRSILDEPVSVKAQTTTSRSGREAATV